MKRRNFIKTGLGFSAFTSLPFLNSGEKAQSWPELNIPKGSIAQDDEKFWSQVREQFPLNNKYIYLNTGSVGPSPHVVVNAVQKKTEEIEAKAQTGHTAELWHLLKTTIATFLGCQPEEIAYTRNATEGINIVCNGLPLKRGDEIITTTHEHVGNTVAWLARQKREGIVIKVFEPSKDSAQENVDRIEQLVTKKTRALSIPHITTTTGQILPVADIGKLATENHLWYFIDGAQAPGMMPVNLSEIGCHAYATSGHKWLVGPKGTGLLYVRQDMLDVIEAKWVGAYSNSGNFDIRTGEFHFHPTAQRYEYGTVNTPYFVGLGAALDFLHRIGVNNLWRRNFSLATVLKDGLNKLDVEVLSPQHPDEHSSIITFKIKNVDRAQLQSFLAKEYRLRTRGIYEGGLNGIRISLHLYNSFQDVECVLEGVEAAKKL